MSARTECATPPGHHDHFDRRVFFGAINGGIERHRHIGTPRVESLRAVERDDRDTAGSDLVEHRLLFVVGGTHRSLLATCGCGGFMHPYCIRIGTAPGIASATLVPA